MRTLIFVPIIHSEADLGSLADDVRSRFQEAFGAEVWRRRRTAVRQMWAGIRQRLLAMPLKWSHTRLYQDGLPVCDYPQMIVDDLAAQGSDNHKLLATLVEQGAILMGTESVDLMMREYRRIQKLVEASREDAPDEAVEGLREEGDELLSLRDRFIADRIDATLGPEETGVLFMGLLHRVDELLEGKVDPVPIIHNLPFGADPLWKLRKRGRSSA